MSGVNQLVGPWGGGLDQVEGPVPGEGRVGEGEEEEEEEEDMFLVIELIEEGSVEARGGLLPSQPHTARQASLVFYACCMFFIFIFIVSIFVSVYQLSSLVGV